MVMLGLVYVYYLPFHFKKRKLSFWWVKGIAVGPITYK